jgi:hypothetical protein
MERLLVDGVNRHLGAVKQAWIVRRVDFRRVVRCVPHSAQNSRVTGRSGSLRVNCLGGPLV